MQYIIDIPTQTTARKGAIFVYGKTPKVFLTRKNLFKVVNCLPALNRILGRGGFPIRQAIFLPIEDTVYKVKTNRLIHRCLMNNVNKVYIYGFSDDSDRAKKFNEYIKPMFEEYGIEIVSEDRYELAELFEQEGSWQI